jgi:hypothetical protein
MAQVYAQAQREKNIAVITGSLATNACRQIILQHVGGWMNSKKGRKAKDISYLETAFYYSDGKLACTMWIETLPPPANEPKFAPAVGAIPGLTP